MRVPAGAVAVGERVSVVIEIVSASEVGHTPFHVTFDPRVLEFDHGVEGAFLQSDGNQTAFFAATSSRGGSVVVGLSRLGRVPGVSGSGDLCVLNFNAIGPGNAALAFSRAKVRDASNQIIPSIFQPAVVVVQ